MIPQNGTVTSNINESSIKTQKFISCENEPKRCLNVFSPFVSGIDLNCYQGKIQSNAKYSCPTCLCKHCKESTGEVVQ